MFQPAISKSEVIDEWKLFQVDNELPDYNQQERIEKYWNNNNNNVYFHIYTCKLSYNRQTLVR